MLQSLNLKKKKALKLLRVQVLSMTDERKKLLSPLGLDDYLPFCLNPLRAQKNTFQEQKRLFFFGASPAHSGGSSAPAVLAFLRASCF